MVTDVLNGATPEALASSDESAALGALLPIHRRVLQTLSSSGVSCVLLRLPVASEPARDLDLLVSSAALEAIARVLGEMGFLPKASPLGLPSKVVFTGFDGERFHNLDVHTSVVSSRGLVYLDARTVLERRVLREAVPLLSTEDSLLHLVLHPLLGRGEIGGKYSSRIRQLASLPLDWAYVRSHLARYGLGQTFDEALGAVLGHRRPDPADLTRRARRRVLVGHPLNLLGALRSQLAAVLRFRRRAGLVAFVGVDGVGKSSLVHALTTRLSALGLRTSNVYLGCWGRYQTRAARVGSFSPRDAPAVGESKAGALLRRAKNLVKFGLFYGAILFEQWVRYVRGVVRTPSHLVLSDRYIYDLEIPFSRRYVQAGQRVRGWIYWLFPDPDMIVHLQAPPEDIRARKAELTLDEMREFDAIYRGILAGRTVEPVVVDGTPEEIAARLIATRWTAFLRASWRHGSTRSLRRLFPTALGEPRDGISHEIATFR